MKWIIVDDLFARHIGLILALREMGRGSDSVVNIVARRSDIFAQSGIGGLLELDTDFQRIRPVQAEDVNDIRDRIRAESTGELCVVLMDARFDKGGVIPTGHLEPHTSCLIELLPLALSEAVSGSVVVWTTTGASAEEFVTASRIKCPDRIKWTFSGISDTHHDNIQFRRAVQSALDHVAEPFDLWFSDIDFPSQEMLEVTSPAAPKVLSAHNKRHIDRLTSNFSRLLNDSNFANELRHRFRFDSEHDSELLKLLTTTDGRPLTPLALWIFALGAYLNSTHVGSATPHVYFVTDPHPYAEYHWFSPLNKQQIRNLLKGVWRLTDALLAKNRAVPKFRLSIDRLTIELDERGNGEVPAAGLLGSLTRFIQADDSMNSSGADVTRCVYQLWRDASSGQQQPGNMFRELENAMPTSGVVVRQATQQQALIEFHFPVAPNQ